MLFLCVPTTFPFFSFWVIGLKYKNTSYTDFIAWLLLKFRILSTDWIWSDYEYFAMVKEFKFKHKNASFHYPLSSISVSKGENWSLSWNSKPAVIFTTHSASSYSEKASGVGECIQLPSITARWQLGIQTEQRERKKQYLTTCSPRWHWKMLHCKPIKA